MNPSSATMGSPTPATAGIGDVDLQASLEVLRSHVTPSSGPQEPQSPSAQAAQALSHGYSEVSPPPNEPPSEGQASQDDQIKEEDFIHPDLRAHNSGMMAAAAAAAAANANANASVNANMTPNVNHNVNQNVSPNINPNVSPNVDPNNNPNNHNVAPAANMMPTTIPMTGLQSHSDPSPPQVEHQMLAPAPPLPQQSAQSPEDRDDSGGGRRGKRELSQSKRAAQNRAAQRAFRRRKEEYIKKLEERVSSMNNLEDGYRYIAQQNALYREYVGVLQGQLLETQGKFPPPPANLNMGAESVPQVPEEQPPQDTGPLAIIARAVMTPPRPVTTPAVPPATETPVAAERQQQDDGQGNQDDINRQMAMQVDGL